MEFDTEEIQSVVFIEPKTNNVIIKITGFPNQYLSELYIGWVMTILDFDYKSTSGNFSNTLN